MSAPTDKRSVHFVEAHAGTDLAFAAERVVTDGLIVEEVHRVAKAQNLQGGLHLYETACDRLFILAADARSLSSGVPGDKCTACWAHLPVEDVAA